MNKLYQAFMPLFTLPLINPGFNMLKCPEFLMIIALDKSSAGSEKHFCYLDTWQLQQMNLLKQLGIKANISHNEFK